MAYTHEESNDGPGQGELIYMSTRCTQTFRPFLVHAMAVGLHIIRW